MSPHASPLMTQTAVFDNPPPPSTCLPLLPPAQGVHYGMFPGAGSPPTTVWTALRPHNWRPATSTEWLVELDMVTGEAGWEVTGVTRVTGGGP